MELMIERSAGVAVVAVAGRLDPTTGPVLQQRLEECLAAGDRRLVVDCAGLDYVSSAGLRVFLAAAKRLRPLGGELAFAGLHGVAREVFEISGFPSLFRIFATAAEARGALTPA